MGAHWALLEEESFRQAREAIEPDVRQFDEVMDAVTWLIARRGDDFRYCPEIRHSGIRLARARVPSSADEVIEVWFRLNVLTDTAHLIFLSIGSLAMEEDDS